MSRFTLISVVAIALLLVGATAVFAQNQNPGYGRSMMQAPAATAPSTTTPTTPGNTGNNQNYSGMMGNGSNGRGMMGNGAIINSEDMQAAHQAMQNGDWNGMRDACQKAWEKNQGSNGQTQPSSTTGSQAGARTTT